ncbi:sulfur carrier protein ThiS [Tenacibaculum sp. M341]|uniref:sulfur carrier protein ThiS n=1 Tax=Tenacibaculum sp. M341 TaxID=2530339 RepID=UPI001053A6D7|nr:sulfur carrier protein ThiS [Tenacibaculum sp. M341]TCI92597.1 sulfur carrier protein ThiS [Tenacibaculum sp. M341]
MISIKVNDTPKQVSINSTLQQLLDQLEVKNKGIAIAVNNNIIKKTDWNHQTLLENDNVLIIKSTQGG